MTIQKIIKTEEDYNLALSRIDRLMDVKPGTTEFDELELISTLVEIYEDKHFPISMPDPISAIKFRMEQLGLNQQDLVAFIGSRSRVSEVLNRKRNLTLAMMRALNKGLGISPDILLREPDAFFPEDVPQLEYDKFPIKEMAKKGWILKIPDLAIHSEEIIRELIRNAGGMKSVECCLFRKSKSARENAKNDPYALMSWCLKILEIANSNELPSQYVEGSINDSFLRDIAKLSYFENGPFLAKEYLEKHGIHLITLPHLSKTYLDGAVIFPPNKGPVIGLTLRYDRTDNFWFCLLHELAHLSKYLGINGDGLIIDDFDLRKYDDKKEIDSIEQQADLLAQEALIPSEAWEEIDLQEEKMPEQLQILELANKLKIHPSIIAGRIRYERNNYRKFSNLLGHGCVRKHFFSN
ncbi:helix-turn-helix domain-containing protein [Chloroflexota bacterium]